MGGADIQGRTYYYDSVTGITQWHAPAPRIRGARRWREQVLLPRALRDVDLDAAPLSHSGRARRNTTEGTHRRSSTGLGVLSGGRDALLLQPVHGHESVDAS